MSDLSATWESIPYLDRQAMKNTAIKASGSEPPKTDDFPMGEEGRRYLDAFRNFAENFKGPIERISRAEIVQEIRELDAMKYENPVLAELCFHRINELLDLLDLAD